MPSFYRKPVIKYPIFALIVLAVVTVLLNLYFNWIIGAVGLFVLAGVLYFLKWADTQVQKEIDSYISTLSYRVKKVGEEALMEMPIGIMLFNDQYYIEWTNPFLASCFHESTLVGRSLYDTFESIVPLIKQEVETGNSKSLLNGQSAFYISLMSRNRYRLNDSTKMNERCYLISF